MWRFILGCLVGILTSIFTIGLSVTVMVYFDIGPMAQFVNHVIPQIIAKQSFDDYSIEIMRRGIVFGSLVILPLSSLIGSLVGTVVSLTCGVWVGLIVAVPIVVGVIFCSGAIFEIFEILSILLCLAIGGGTGYIVGRFLIGKRKKPLTIKMSKTN